MSETPGPAELEAAGVYDPSAPDAAERLALLEYLIEVGATLDDLVATDTDEVPALASSIGLWGPREMLTIGEVAGAVGVDPELIARAWRSAGFPEPDRDSEQATFVPRDVEVVEIVRAGIALFGEDVTIQLLRVIGAAAARVAEATVSAFVVNVASAAVDADPSGLALARANVDSTFLLDGLSRGFDTLLRHHIERSFRPQGVMQTSPGVDLVQRSVGFADLVDSTSWAQELDLPALAVALTCFDNTASEVVVEHGGRVVKLIGDEIMFVADGPPAAVDIGLALVDAFAEHDVLPPVRVGVASGALVARDGDYSGPVVNLAARAVKAAEPSTLLVDEATAGALSASPTFVTGDTRTFRLKGFGEPVRLARVDPVR